MENNEKNLTFSTNKEIFNKKKKAISKFKEIYSYIIWIEQI